MSQPANALLALTAFTLVATPARAAEQGWVSLFDGKTLAGWKAATEGPSSFNVVDGTIAADGPKSHLFYMGADGQASFENFELSVEVRARAGANSGVFIHTAYQDKDWPSQGFEIQVDNSQEQHGDYLEMKMTGSLYGVRNAYKAMAKDDEWFTMSVLVRRPRVQVRVDGALLVDWIEPAGPLPEGAPKVNRLGRGTFALQCHDPGSKAFFRNLRVRPLPASADVAAAPAPVVNERYLQILDLGKANFPLVDLHAHLKGGLTLEQALALSRETGMFLGLAANCGKGFPIETDAAVKSGVAIEIGARYKIPSERFLRFAKSKGAKFTFGTNNAGAGDLGDWSYPLAMQKALGLTWKDMFVPGHGPSRAQRE